jgi:dienelactone hydrolase
LEDGAGFDPSAFADQAAWQRRAKAVREQVLVATGLWPLPPRTPLNPQVFDLTERDGYSIAKVVLETFPGFYLTGNLYRPAGENVEKAVQGGRRPGILSPHGHWDVGRFHADVQARQIHLARMGATVFAYDMVGFGDSKPFGHDFEDGDLELMGIDLTGVQLWNSIRALDWLLTLPDVDADRVACTGASGGGTQTFLLTAVDDRVKVAAPVCMVSAAMQGGSHCENADNLRIDTNNVEFAALAAPRPLLLVGATGDWTKEIETNGYPEIQKIYDLYAARDRVHCEVHDFGHNYNQTSRESVYRWFSKHLFGNDGQVDAKESPLSVEPEENLRCFSPSNPRPDDALDKQGLKNYLKGVVAAQAEQFRPTSAEQWPAARDLLLVGYQNRVPVRLPDASELHLIGEIKRLERDGFVVMRGLATSGRGDRVPYALYARQDTMEGAAPYDATLVVHPAGSAALVEADGTPHALVRGLLDQGRVVAAIDVFLAGDHHGAFRPTSRTDTRHLLCYNRATLVERVQDVLTSLSGLKMQPRVREIDMVGVGEAGAWCLLALPHAPFVRRTLVDADDFDYHLGHAVSNERLLPGVLRFGGLRGLASLAAPARVWVHNTGAGFDATWMEAAYQITGANDNLKVSPGLAETTDIVAWLAEN